MNMNEYHIEQLRTLSSYMKAELRYGIDYTLQNYGNTMTTTNSMPSELILITSP
jgi:hypothetical protein